MAHYAKKRAVIEELELIRSKNKGILNPEDVVDFAKSANTALHDYFEWDNGKAAHEHRLWQARSLIRVIVQVHEPTGETVRAFVSLSTDQTDGKGYRSIKDVMSKEELKDILLSDAKRELKYFKDKYNSLSKISEFKPIFTAFEEMGI